MDWTPLLWLALGLALLVAGAELLVRGAAALAGRLGVSPLVVGVTIVAVGTSAPEVAVTVQAAAAGSPDLGVGNVLGSNVFNVLVVLGASAALSPIVVSARLVRWDVPVMIGASLLVWVLAADGRVGRIDGAVLLTLLAGYVLHALRGAGREAPAVEAEYAEALGPRGAAAGLGRRIAEIVAGLVVLVVGARWLVAAGTDLARAFGLSELVIGLTVVAAGTSLPELATSLAATWRGERDIAAGNAIGSNVWNLLFVLGLAALVAPAGLPVAPATLRFDLPVMTAVAIACLPIVTTGHLIARWEGLLFLGYFVAYTTYLVLAGTSHDLLPAFSAIMLRFVIPLTVLTIGVTLLRSRRRPTA